MNEHVGPRQRKATILIPCNNADNPDLVSVAATIIGPFAVHRNTSILQAEPWAVSHLRTGYRVCSCWSRLRAVALARRLRDLYRTDQIDTTVVADVVACMMARKARLHLLIGEYER
jgi:hypothetical protein